MYRRIVAIAALAMVVAGCAFPEQGSDTPDQIGGTYYVNGTDARGVEYGGQLIITRPDNRSDYELQWIITGSIQTGAGTFGRGILDATWQTVEGFAPVSGTARYELQDDGSLIGERFEEGMDEPGYEEAFPVLE